MAHSRAGCLRCGHDHEITFDPRLMQEWGVEACKEPTGYYQGRVDIEVDECGCADFDPVDRNEAINMGLLSPPPTA